MSGRLVISLDFELMWGVRDHRSTVDYGDAVLGVRRALPALLTVFRKYRINATWAIVGLLFARTRQEMLEYYPTPRPEYRRSNLSPYETVCSQIGVGESEDPWHYGRSLVDQVLQAEGQEIATHTYSHYYCLEDGSSLQTFEADLQAAIEIMGSAGVKPRSIVFPRNQMTDAHLQACARQGLSAFRGNPETYLYRTRSKQEIGPFVRGLRLVDANFGIGGCLSYDAPTLQGDCVNVPASRFFRPYVPSLGVLNNLHVTRIIREMESAAKAGEVYHLWCHPHNFGRHTLQQLTRLEVILRVYQDLHDKFGMTSNTMSELAAPIIQSSLNPQ